MSRLQRCLSFRVVTTVLWGTYVLVANGTWREFQKDTKCFWNQLPNLPLNVHLKVCMNQVTSTNTCHQTSTRPQPGPHCVPVVLCCLLLHSFLYLHLPASICHSISPLPPPQRSPVSSHLLCPPPHRQIPTTPSPSFCIYCCIYFCWKASLVHLLVDQAEEGSYS